jgi:hypothetical protein
MTVQFPPINTCQPSRIFGPLGQYVFLGASVKSFTVTAGWNEQASSITVELVEDPCIGPKFWWDENLVIQHGNIADPGFLFPDPGTPVYFRILENDELDENGNLVEEYPGGFEYAGLLQNWIEKKDPSGNPAYSVTISDPRLILENCQLIVNDYPGDVEGVSNLINVYGWVESLGATCLASPAGAIGGTTDCNSNLNPANERGMNWNDVKCAIRALTAAPAPYITPWNSDGRLRYIDSTNQGYGIIFGPPLENGRYLVDLSCIDFGPASYRISGPNISLMEVISQVCEDSGNDYYIELLPVNYAGGIKKVIKVRTANRTQQPQLGLLDDFIQQTNANAVGNNGGIISYTRGEEARNEPTSIYLMGGKIRDMFESTNSDMLPFWGYDTQGNLVQAAVSNGEYFVDLDVTRLNATLNTSIGGTYVTISESELRAALGDIDTWKAVSHAKNGQMSTHLDNINQSSTINFAYLQQCMAGNFPTNWVTKVLPSTDTDRQTYSNSAKDLDKIYNWIKSYADEFYGKQFLVNASDFVCSTIDPETGKYRNNYDPSTDGGWVPDGTNEIINLEHNTAESDIFRDDKGKYGAIVRYPVAAGFSFGGAGGGYICDPSKIGDDNYVTNGTYIWQKAEVDGKWVRGTNLAPSSNIACFLLKTNSVITRSNEGQIEPFAGNNIILDARSETQPITVDELDRGQFTSSALPLAISPDASACPRLSNVSIYGPWGTAGPPGQVRLEQDEGFVPWEYGSDVVMNAAAGDKVDQSATSMRIGERGSVTVAGFPNIPIGAELNSQLPGNFPTVQNFFESRFAQVDYVTSQNPYIFININPWVGAYGPNVTSINVSVGSNGFTTAYQFSTYTPLYGRFAKGNAERLKRIGQTRLNNARNLRAKLGGRSGFQQKMKQRVEDQVSRSSRSPTAGSNVMSGKYTSNGFTDTNQQPIKDVNQNFPDEASYQSTAFNSLDLNHRPVSKAGEGGFSRFIEHSERPRKSGEVWQDILDPLSGPGDPIEPYAEVFSGHPIEIVARGSSPPPSGYSVQQVNQTTPTKNTGYTSDYRFMAHAGPMILQQWGYDLEGYPVPNQIDVAAQAELGNFQSGDATPLSFSFLDGWLQQPKTWPVAPIDLRLDRDRGVWTIPVTPRRVKFVLSTSFDNTGQATAKIIDDYAAGGGATLGEEITVNDPRKCFGNAIGSGELLDDFQTGPNGGGSIGIAIWTRQTKSSDADPPTPDVDGYPRFEVEQCTQRCRILKGNVENLSLPRGADPDETVDVFFNVDDDPTNMGDWPYVDYCSEWSAGGAGGAQFRVEAKNYQRFSAGVGWVVIERRMEQSDLQDSANQETPYAGTVATEEWVIVDVEKPIARWHKLKLSDCEASTLDLEEGSYAEGEDPIEVEYFESNEGHADFPDGLSVDCVDPESDYFWGFWDNNSQKYKAITTDSALYGRAHEISAIADEASEGLSEDLIEVGGCELVYKTRKAKVFGNKAECCSYETETVVKTFNWDYVTVLGTTSLEGNYFEGEETTAYEGGHAVQGGSNGICFSKLRIPVCNYEDAGRECKYICAEPCDDPCNGDCSWVAVEDPEAEGGYKWELLTDCEQGVEGYADCICPYPCIDPVTEVANDNNPDCPDIDECIKTTSCGDTSDNCNPDCCTECSLCSANQGFDLSFVAPKWEESWTQTSISYNGACSVIVEGYYTPTDQQAHPGDYPCTFTVTLEDDGASSCNMILSASPETIIGINRSVTYLPGYTGNCCNGMPYGTDGAGIDPANPNGDSTTPLVWDEGQATTSICTAEDCNGGTTPYDPYEPDSPPSGPSNLACLDVDCEETSFRFDNWNVGSKGDGPYNTIVWSLVGYSAPFSQDGVATVRWDFYEIIDELGLGGALVTTGFGTATLECADDPALAGGSNYQIRLEGFPTYANLQHAPNIAFCDNFTTNGVIFRDTCVGCPCPEGRYQGSAGVNDCDPAILRYSVNLA